MENIHVPILTIEQYKGIDYLCYDGQRHRPATPQEIGLWGHAQAEIERIKAESENVQRWEQVRDWLAEACPDRNWEAGIMPTGRNGDDGKLPD